MRLVRRHAVFIGIAAAVTAVSSLVASSARTDLEISSEVLRVPVYALDVVISVTQDPFLGVYFVWPLIVLLFAMESSQLTRTPVLLRMGSGAAVLAYQARRSAVQGGVIALITLASAAVFSLDLPWVASVGPLSSSGMDQFHSLYVAAHGAPGAVVVVALQVVYFAATSSVLGAGFALVALVIPAMHRVIAIVVALGAPIMFKAWVLPEILSPMNALFVTQAVNNRAPLWWPILFCVALVVVLTGIARWREQDENDTPLRIELSPRWAIYWSGVLLCSALLLARQGGDSSFLRQALYGAGSDEFSLVPWAFTNILWAGAALVLMLEWSSILTERLPYLALRYGRLTSIIWRRVIHNLLQSLGCSAAVVCTFAVVDLAAGRQHAGWLEALYLIVAPALCISIVVQAGVILAWASGRLAAPLAALFVGSVLSVPAVNPLWPWPTAVAFAGAWSSQVPPLLLVASVAITWCVLVAIMLAMTRRGVPNFE